MMRLTLALLWCACACASDYTSSQAGAWSDSATWGGSGVPGIGDTATVNHAVTVDVDTTIGTSPAAGNTVLTVNAALTVAMGKTLTLRGDLDHEDVAITLQAGSTFQFDSTQASSPSTTSYRVFQADTSAPKLNRKIVSQGTSGSHVTIKSVSGSGNGRFEVDWFGSAQWDLTYTDFSDVGDATHPALLHSLYYADQVFRLTHVTFLRCGGITGNGIGGGGSSPSNGSEDFYLRYVYWDQTLTAYCFEANGSTVTPTTGTWELDHVAGDKRIGYANAMFNVSSIRDSLLPDFGFGTSSTIGSFSRNVLWQRAYAGGGSMAVYGDMSDIFVLADYDQYNPHVLSNYRPFTWDRGLYEYTGNGGDGDGVVIDVNSTPAIIKHVIDLPRRDRTNAGNTFVSMALCNANPEIPYSPLGSHTVTIEHNTLWGGSGSDHGVKGGEQCTYAAGSVASYKSNLYYDTTAQGNHFFTGPGHVLTDNEIDPSNATHNGSWNALASSRPGKSSDNTYYDLPTTGATPGANDVHADPQFVDASRTIAKFDTGYLGQSVATAWVSGHSYAAGDTVSYSATDQWGGVAINYRAIRAHTSSSSNAPLSCVRTGCPAPGPDYGTIADDQSWHYYWELNATYQLRAATAAGTVYTDASVNCGSGCAPTLAVQNWIRAGYAPTNTAYLGTGHDGADIGAVPVVQVSRNRSNCLFFEMP